MNSSFDIPDFDDGVPIEDDAEGDYWQAATTPAGVRPQKPANKGKKWPFLLLVPLLAGGVYFALNRNGEEIEEPTAPIPSRPHRAPLTPPRTAAQVAANLPAKPSTRLAIAPAMRPSTKITAGSAPQLLTGVVVMRDSGGQLVGMRRALEADGWTVHWLARQQEARAWKAISSDRKIWAEVRLTPAGTRATLFSKGPAGKILKQDIVPMTPHPRLRQGTVLAPSPLLERATAGRLRVGSDGKPFLTRISPPA